MDCNHSLGSFHLAVTQETKILSGLLIYSLTSLVLGLLVQYGLYSRRRWLLMPHMIFLSLLMMPVILSVLMFGFSPLVYLILLPWTCILTLVRSPESVDVSATLSVLFDQVLDSWFCIGSLSRPVDQELGTGSRPTTTGGTVTDQGSDLPPPYEEILNLSVKSDEGLPSYEEAVSSVSSAGQHCCES